MVKYSVHESKYNVENKEFSSVKILDYREDKLLGDTLYLTRKTTFELSTM